MPISVPVNEFSSADADGLAGIASSSCLRGETGGQNEILSLCLHTRLHLETWTKRGELGHLLKHDIREHAIYLAENGGPLRFTKAAAGQAQLCQWSCRFDLEYGACMSYLTSLRICLETRQNPNSMFYINEKLTQCCHTQRSHFIQSSWRRPPKCATFFCVLHAANDRPHGSMFKNGS